jgi:hypothetical protein
MSARAILSWVLRSMNPGLGPSGPPPMPFFAAWPGAPLCWGRALDPHRET